VLRSNYIKFPIGSLGLNIASLIIPFHLQRHKQGQLLVLSGTFLFTSRSISYREANNGLVTFMNSPNVSRSLKLPT
jgi:hypothetical protein